MKALTLGILLATATAQAAERRAAPARDADLEPLRVAKAWFDMAESGQWDDVEPILLCERTYHYQDLLAFEGRRRVVGARTLRRLERLQLGQGDYLKIGPRGDRLNAALVSELERSCRPPKGVRVFIVNDGYGIDYGEELVLAPTKSGYRVVAWLRPKMLCDEDPC